MRFRTIGALLLLSGVAAAAGCAKPWYGFEWMFPTAPGQRPGSDEELISKMRQTDEEVWATGVSDRSRDIESRLGIRD